jgi:hypothetical protein
MKSLVALSCALLMPPPGLPSNVPPLAFGMSVPQVAAALGQPLTQVSGRAGHEIYFAATPAGAPGFSPVDQGIHLQFRKGCLTGWKTHWGMRHTPY